MPPRKYKPKPPISALDEAAAQHRRAQSCKAQRAYRQRKEDTIATLSKQMQGLEATIERLSTCFLGLNDKILRHLGKVEDAVTIFSGPAFYGLTPQTLPLHPSTPSSSAESLAHRIYTTTIAKAFALLQTHSDDDPIFRRVFAIYFTAFPEAQVRGEVARMMMSRDDWNPYYRPRGTEQGWWSALQVATFICSRNWVFDKAGDKVCLGREGRGGVEVAVEEFLDEVLVDARCDWDLWCGHG
ncbi:hypothetical protein D6D26_10425 [Aureobasidium pullulans]|nr:hypothetical protein D6D26_10425 [Aureobasidium pullulans]